MSLSISYKAESGSTAHPGSKISGTVHFSTPKSTSISAVSITFSGRCKVKIREHIHYTTRTFRSRGYYFYNTLPLFDGQGYTHKAGEYSWPFAFVVPKHAAHQHEVDAPGPGRPRRELDSHGFMKFVEEKEGGMEKDHFPPKVPWRASADMRVHALPDSSLVVNSKWPVDFEAKVEYVLIAKVEKPASGSKLFASKGSALESIVAVEMRSKLGMDDGRLLTSGQRQRSEYVRWVDVDRARKGKSVVGKMLSKVSPKNESAEQGQKFNVMVEVATAFCSQSTIPFTIRVITKAFGQPPVNDEGTARRQIESYSITDISISLLGKTSARDDSRAAIEHTAVKTEREVLSFRRDDSNLNIVFQPLNGGGRDLMLCGAADLEDLIHVPAVTPSFSTYNIAKEYMLEYEVKMSILGESVSIGNSSSMVKVIVLPPERGVPVSPAIANSVDGQEIAAGSAEPLREKHDHVPTKEAEAAQERQSQVPQEGPPEQLPAYEPSDLHAYEP